MAGVEAGQRFPFISLQKAVDRAEELYKAEPRGTEMSVPTAFAVWKYSEKSSGGFQTVATLKMYGLMVDSSAGEGRQVKLSEDALRYFRDERDEERVKLLRKFSRQPTLLHSLWEKWGGTPPSDTVARSHLKVDRTLNDQSARTLLGIYKDNLNFTGLKGRGKVPAELSEADGPSTDEGTKAKIGDYIQWTQGGVDQFKLARRVTWVADDKSYVRVHGSPTGMLMEEITVVDPPQPPKLAGAPGAEASAGDAAHSDINVYLTGNRLQITADVDEKGLETLKKMLEKYGDILKMVG